MKDPMPKPRTRATGPREATPELIRAALDCIPPDVDRDTWARLAMAVKASDLADAAAFDLWNEWSARGASYSERDARDTWRSVKAGGAIKVGTLFGIAKEHGFKFPTRQEGAAPVQTPAQAAELAEAKRREREAEAAKRQRLHEVAAERSAELWARASEDPPAMGCPYLKRKGVAAHGLRFMPGGAALVPMRDAAGRLWSVQRLLAAKLRDGRTGEAGTDKLYGPPKASPDEEVSSRKLGLFHVIGDAEAAAGVLLLAEGYATGATLHEATGRPVAVAFDAGNLVHVARELRGLHPALALLVCGDDDRDTEARSGKNPGRLKAAAAVAVATTEKGRAGALFPEFPPAGAGADAASASAGKDFNDLATLAGAEAVRGQVEAACAALLAGTLPAPAARAGLNPGAGRADAGADDAEAQRSAATAPGGAGAGGGDGGGEADSGEVDPFGGRRDPFELDARGVWFLGRDKEGNDKPSMWLCAPLAVTARTRADDANGWGVLLEFSDPDGNPKTWAMPSALLSGEGAEWAGRLRDMGLQMAPGTAARNLVAQYIDTRKPTERVTCTDRVGWHGGVYVLPSSCIGEASGGRRYVFQSDAGMEDTFRRAGELGAWRSQVAARAEGNSRLVFALCCAFAGPMLRPAGMESGGFHLRGTSSLGKTTALKVAASVWGRPSYMQRWRTTDNALEATAVQHCDGLLILDEFGQLDPRVAGECAYMLANDQEKGRATRGGLPRKRRTWRLLFLSSGEVSLADHMAEAGKRAQAGMEVRMVDVPLDAGAGMGGLEELHDAASPAELADAITAAAARTYGTAGRAWLEWACARHAEMPDRLQALIDRYRAELVPESASEQVRRVGSRFALVAAAGELATETGITGWAGQHALWAVHHCFSAWLAARGHLNNGEEAAMLGQVRAWLEKNGDALLTWLHRAHDDHKPATPLRAGFKRLVGEDGKPLKIDAATEYVDKLSAAESTERRTALVEYLVLPEAFRRDVCKGVESAAVAKLLRRRGHLVHEGDRLTTKHRLPGMGKVPCFHIKPSIFADELGAG